MASFLLFVLWTFCSANSNDKFIYPSTMPNPFQAQIEILSFLAPRLLQYETPIQVRIAAFVDDAPWNCIASYHLTALNTFENIPIRASNVIITEHGNSNTRMLCFAYTSSILFKRYFPDDVDAFLSLYISYGLDVSFGFDINDDVLQCIPTDNNCLKTVASNYDYTPDIMASIVALQLFDFANNDGWNEDGSLAEFGQCTANCEAYSDYTGYAPVGRPYRSYKRKDTEHENEFRWVPLMEGNGKGFFDHYDHVVPHIGLKAQTRVILRSDLESISAPNPYYDYPKETKKVMDRLIDVATNDTKKMLIEFMDNKVNVLVALLTNLDGNLPWNWEERNLWIAGVSEAVYDAVIQAWLEKRRWDLIRPTSVIKRWGNRKITTFGGPYKGVKEINAADFEAYIRVMPHSEYPSASACICLSIAEFTDTYLQQRWGITSIPIDLPIFGGVIPRGSSIIEPGLTPKEDLFITMKDLTDLFNTCSESRLWGGMHFTDSIIAGKQICDGIGRTTFDHIEDLLNGSPI